MRQAFWIILMCGLGATPASAGDPTLRHRAPSLTPHGGAWTPSRPAPSPSARHAAEVNARAQAGIEATTRRNMRSIDNGVIERIGNPKILPQIRKQREIEEDLAGMRQQQRWDEIDRPDRPLTNLSDARDSLGRPYGEATRRVLERSGIQLEVLQNKWWMKRDLDGLEKRMEAAPGPPEFGDHVPRERSPR